MDHHLFLPWFDRLAADVEVILFDFSGNGASLPDLPREEMSREVWLRDIEDVRTHLGLDQIAVLGHSYGGYLAQEYALTHPERVSKLILSNTTPVLDFPETIFQNAEDRGSQEQVEMIVKAFSSPVESDDDFEEAFRTLLPLYFHRWDPAVGESLLQGIRFRAEAFNVGNYDELPTFDTRDRLGELDVSTLVISGSDDWIMPVEHGGRRLAELIPNAQHVVFERSGHFPYAEESAHFFRTIVEFLQEAPS